MSYTDLVESGLTISSTIVSWELVEIGILKAFMIVVQRTHHARPGLREHQVSLAFALNLNSALVQQRGLHTKERERLRKIITIKSLHYVV